jgi:hypothetical protein
MARKMQDKPATRQPTGATMCFAAVKRLRPWQVPLHCGLAVLAVAIGCLPCAHAFELEPFEYAPAPPGTTALFDYIIYGDDLSYHPVGGPTYTHDTGLTEAVGIARATQFVALGPFEGLVEVLQPYGALTGARIGGTSYQDSGGLGDTTTPHAPISALPPTSRCRTAPITPRTPSISDQTVSPTTPKSPCIRASMITGRSTSPGITSCMAITMTHRLHTTRPCRSMRLCNFKAS